LSIISQTIGKMKVIKAPEHQLQQVVTETTFCSTISGIYNHIIGPKVKAIIPRNKNNETIIIKSLTALD